MEVRMGVDRQIGGRERGEIKDYYNKSCSILQASEPELDRGLVDVYLYQMRQTDIQLTTWVTGLLLPARLLWTIPLKLLRI